MVHVVPAAGRAAAAVTPAAEHLNAVCDDLGHVFLLAVLVVPTARLEPAFDVDLLALLQIVLQRFRLFAEQLDPVPLGLLLPVVVLILTAIGGGEAEAGDREAAWRELQLRVAPEIAHQN